MKLAFVSPLPPARSGVADYAAGLLPALRARATVDVVATALPGYDNYIYQIGNNPLHLPAYRAATAVPGISVLHDGVLHHLLLGILDEGSYIDEFVYNYGEWNRGLALDLWRSRGASASARRYFQYPMLRRVVETSRAVIVHNPEARQMAEAALPAGARRSIPVVEVPHYFVAPKCASNPVETRRRLGIGPDEIVVGVFGYLRDSMRIPSILRALPAAPHARLLLAGEFVSADLERALAERLRAVRAICTGHVSEADFWSLAQLTDICVNMRDPSAGETSGIGIRMMGLGKPVLVTDGPAVSGFPDLSVVRIDPGEAEVEMLAQYLRLLSEREEIRREVGCRAAEHIAARHTIHRAAQLYMDLAQTTGNPSED